MVAVALAGAVGGTSSPVPRGPSTAGQPPAGGALEVASAKKGPGDAVETFYNILMVHAALKKKSRP